MLLIDDVECAAYTVPTDQPESDGTLQWDSTTCVVVTVRCGETTGLGYTYAPRAAACVVDDTLRSHVIGADPMQTGEIWAAMVHSIRNQGRAGVVSCAISAVDIALWDLRARLLGVSLAVLLGGHRREVPIYGSGGFTSFDDEQLIDQLSNWVDDGIGRVKMKVGRRPDDDARRVSVARQAIGPDTELFVDANGAYTRKQAVALAEAFADEQVTWFEEPVSSDDLDGLHLLRDRSPAGMDVTAGEYGYELSYFRRMLDAHAVDCLQVDVTRCGGITSFLRVAALADAHNLDVSSHTAPHVSAFACSAIWHLRHLEYFDDHVRLEHLLFDGVLEPDHGVLRPDPSRTGLGIELRSLDVERYL
jgi:L-alanine-DL-glutamate epimerase-like enolase superfamily enzyme